MLERADQRDRGQGRDRLVGLGLHHARRTSLETAQIDLDRLAGGAVEVHLERGGAHRERIAAILAAPRRGREARGRDRRLAARRRRHHALDLGQEPRHLELAGVLIEEEVEPLRAQPARPTAQQDAAARHRGGRRFAEYQLLGLEAPGHARRGRAHHRDRSGEDQRAPVEVDVERVGATAQVLPAGEADAFLRVHPASFLAEVEALGLDLETAGAADHHLALEASLLRALVVDRALALHPVGAVAALHGDQHVFEVDLAAAVRLLLAAADLEHHLVALGERELESLAAHGEVAVRRCRPPRPVSASGFPWRPNR